MGTAASQEARDGISNEVAAARAAKHKEGGDGRCIASQSQKSSQKSKFHGEVA